MVSQPVDFQDSFGIRKQSEMKIILYENQTDLLGDYMNSLAGSVNTINVYIDPEGGFSEKEITLAGENGYIALGLGKRILRAETASLVGLALLQSRFGDI